VPLHEPHQDAVPKEWGKLITDYDQCDDGNDNRGCDSCCNDTITSDCSESSCESFDSHIDGVLTRKRKIKFDPVVHVFVVEGMSHMTMGECQDTWYGKKDFASFRKAAAENRQGQQYLKQRASWSYYAKMTVLNEQDRQHRALITMSIPPCDEIIAALYKEQSKWSIRLAEQNGAKDENDAKMTRSEKARMNLALRRNASRKNIMQDVLQLERNAQQQQQRRERQ